MKTTNLYTARQYPKEDILEILRQLGIRSEQDWAAVHPESYAIALRRKIVPWISTQLKGSPKSAWSEIIEFLIVEGVMTQDEWQSVHPESYSSATRLKIVPWVLGQITTQAKITWTDHSDEDIRDRLLKFKIRNKREWRYQYPELFDVAKQRNAIHLIADLCEWDC